MNEQSEWDIAAALATHFEIAIKDYDRALRLLNDATEHRKYAGGDNAPELLQDKWAMYARNYIRTCASSLEALLSMNTSFVARYFHARLGLLPCELSSFSFEPGLKRSFREVFKAYVGCIGRRDSSIRIDFNSTEWRELVQFLDDRDHLTHPLVLDRFTVDEEMTARAGRSWQYVKSMLARISAACKGYDAPPLYPFEQCRKASGCAPSSGTH